jgi:HEPN domain-containing protein
LSTDETNPRDWLFLARERLAAADALHASMGATLSGVELLQEAIERYLKGYLISKGWSLRRIHNLATLLDFAAGYDAQFAAYTSLCENLTAQFWAQHYPGDDLADVGNDYVELREAARGLIDLIDSCFPDS